MIKHMKILSNLVSKRETPRVSPRGVSLEGTIRIVHTLLHPYVSTDGDRVKAELIYLQG